MPMKTHTAILEASCLKKCNDWQSTGSIYLAQEKMVAEFVLEITAVVLFPNSI